MHAQPALLSAGGRNRKTDPSWVAETSGKHLNLDVRAFAGLQKRLAAHSSPDLLWIK